VDRIGTHTAICRRVDSKSTARGVFDSTRQRMEGVIEPVRTLLRRAPAVSSHARQKHSPSARGALRSTFISHNVLIKSFPQSQFTHKPVNTIL
jgi:hypothetical protein